MSAGDFELTGYTSSINPTRVYLCRIQPETALAEFIANGATGAINAGAALNAVTEPISVNVSGSVRRNGLHARLAYLRLQTGQTPPPGYSASARTVIPILNLTAFSVASIRGATCNYLGVVWRVTGIRAEKGV